MFSSIPDITVDAFEPCHDLRPAVATANGLPTAGIKSEVFIQPLITGDWMLGREQQKWMKGWVWPQYLVEPQHAEGYGEASRTEGGGAGGWILKPWRYSAEGQFECIPDEFDSMPGRHQPYRNDIKSCLAVAQMAFCKIIDRYF